MTPAFAGNIERAEHLLRSGKVDPRARGEYAKDTGRLATTAG